MGLTGTATGVGKSLDGYYLNVGADWDVEGQRNIGLWGYGYAPTIDSYAMNGSQALPTALTNGDAIILWDMYGYSGVSVKRGIRFYGYTLENWGASQAGSALEIQTVVTGTNTNFTSLYLEAKQAEFGGNVVIPTGSASHPDPSYYYGKQSGNTWLEGTWRTTRVDDDLEIQRRVTGTWATRETIYSDTQYDNAWLSISAARAAGAKPATIGLNDNGFVVASFADGQEEQVQVNLAIPGVADTTKDMELCMGWSSPTVTGTCDWEVTYLLTTVNESTEQAGTLLQSYELSSTTANGLITSEFIIYAANIDVNDVCFHLIVERDGNDGGDTLGAVAEVHGLALKYAKKQYI